MNRIQSYHPFAAATIFFWSIAYVIGKVCLTYFSPSALGFLRYFIASLTLIVIVVATKLKPPHKKDIPWFFAAGALGFAIYMIAFNTGQRAVTASTASVVISTVPVVTAVMARFFYKEKLKRLQWAAIGISFIGVIIINLMHGIFSVNYGILWLMLAVLNLSLYNIIQRRLTKTYSALQASTYSIFAGTILLSVFARDSFVQIKGAPIPLMIGVMIMGICSSAFAYVAWSEALARAERISQVSNYMFFTPFLSGIIGFIAIKEVPDTATLVGGAFIIAGMLLFNGHTQVQSIFTKR